ncbi:PIR Superfamily Protein [Plasmodium ovale wallikeri]|uniref:PIR Superfamily Protein n=1 Tax=Plasmodium ovale wallikeri TaxID=864142 RepID=A0A1A9ARW9_PLAOA|nr:PIR Superfamily Protein [Plasmodium ovale wallikeri]SBT58869.1 PIR Superfamily Protein [Plasmodium ovale wallikeri]
MLLSSLNALNPDYSCNFCIITLKYGFVSSLSKYENIFERDTDDDGELIKGQCEDILNKHIKNEVNSSFVNPCANGLKYLTDLNENSLFYKPEACRYLSYRLHRELINDKKSSSSIETLYKNFMIGYDEYVELDICGEYIQHINDDLFEKLQKLINLQYNFNNIINVKESADVPPCTYAKNIVSSYDDCLTECHQNDDDDFCNGLEMFRSQYNTFMETGFSCEGMQKLLPSTRKHNIVISILVPVIIVIVISFILFILHKFTPLDMWICHRIFSNISARDNLGEGIDQFTHTSKILNTNSENRNYKLAYSPVEY